MNPRNWLFQSSSGGHPKARALGSIASILARIQPEISGDRELGVAGTLKTPFITALLTLNGHVRRISGWGGLRAAGGASTGVCVTAAGGSDAGGTIESAASDSR